jgi:hypothetical protein
VQGSTNVLRSTSSSGSSSSVRSSSTLATQSCPSAV